MFIQIGTIVKLIMNDASHSWIDFLVASQHFELSVCRLVELVNVCFITSLNGASLFCIILCPFAQVTGNSDFNL